MSYYTNPWERICSSHHTLWLSSNSTRAFGCASLLKGKFTGKEVEAFHSLPDFFAEAACLQVCQRPTPGKPINQLGRQLPEAAMHQYPASRAPPASSEGVWVRKVSVK